MYTIEYTGILGDKWYSPRTFTRENARAEVRWIMTDGHRFCAFKRASISRARVVPV